MGSASYTKRKYRTTNGHERREKEIQNHEWTRMDTNRKIRATNGHEWNHEWVGGNHERHERHERKIQNHEWTRTGGRNHETHERREREIQNHEWTRMDTNGTTKYRSGTTKHTKKGRGDSMNHERHERIV